MQTQDNVIDCYNKTAKNYADKFIDELSKKHFDRIILQSFALENAACGKLIDLGCGPGQTTKYLADCGLTDLIGTDISPEMIKVAGIINPQLHFETADMLALPYPDNSFGSAVAFYAIVHFDYHQLTIAFNEVKRVLTNDGQFLFSFHIGDTIVHRDNFLDHPVSVDFYFFETSKITDLLINAGFDIIDVVERQPYKDIEYASKRAYIWAKNT